MSSLSRRQGRQRRGARESTRETASCTGAGWRVVLLCMLRVELNETISRVGQYREILSRHRSDSGLRRIAHEQAQGCCAKPSEIQPVPRVTYVPAKITTGAGKAYFLYAIYSRTATFSTSRRLDSSFPPAPRAIAASAHRVSSEISPDQTCSGLFRATLHYQLITAGAVVLPSLWQAIVPSESQERVE